MRNTMMDRLNLYARFVGSVQGLIECRDDRIIDDARLRERLAELMTEFDERMTEFDQRLEQQKQALSMNINVPHVARREKLKTTEVL